MIVPTGHHCRMERLFGGPQAAARGPARDGCSLIYSPVAATLADCQDQRAGVARHPSSTAPGVPRLLRIRLARRGRKKRPSYRIVVVPSRAARDGRYVDDLGYYDPLSDPSSIHRDVDRAKKWVQHGAQPTDRVWKLLEAVQPGFRDGLKPGGAASGAGAAGSEAEAKSGAAEVQVKARAKPKAKSKSKAKAKSKAKSGSNTKAKQN